MKQRILEKIRRSDKRSGYEPEIPLHFLDKANDRRHDDAHHHGNRHQNHDKDDNRVGHGLLDLGLHMINPFQVLDQLRVGRGQIAGVLPCLDQGEIKILENFGVLGHRLRQGRPIGYIAVNFRHDVPQTHILSGVPDIRQRLQKRNACALHLLHMEKKLDKVTDFHAL